MLLFSESSCSRRSEDGKWYLGSLTVKFIDTVGCLAVMCLLRLDVEVLKENLFLQMLQMAISGDFLSTVKNVHITLLVLRLILEK